MNFRGSTPRDVEPQDARLPESIGTPLRPLCVRAWFVSDFRIGGIRFWGRKLL